MTAAEALKEMRGQNGLGWLKEPVSHAIQWADAIEAELKAKDNELEKLRSFKRGVHESLNMADGVYKP